MPPANASPAFVQVSQQQSTRSSAYGAVLDRLRRFARDETAVVLLQGESGTGKTTLARRIHEQSPRAAGPFQRVILSALDDGIASSELFGHVAGAFTDARQTRTGHFLSAKGGTLFLDEIGKASLTLQGKLLHAIEYGEITPVGSDRTVRVDARIVAASNIDLEELVDAGRFLPDLHARLEHFRVVLPPLRDRRADIPGLVESSVRRHAAAAGYQAAPAIDGDLLSALRAYDWPHNVRQLDGVVHRLLVEAEGADRITLGHCTSDLDFLTTKGRGRTRVTPEAAAEVLKRTRSKSEAARVLGIDRKTLRQIVRKPGGESQRST